MRAKHLYNSTRFLTAPFFAALYSRLIRTPDRLRDAGCRRQQLRAVRCEPPFEEPPNPLESPLLRTARSFSTACAAAAFLLFLSGCHGGTTTKPSVTITISPSVVSLTINSTQQFTTTIAGTTNTAVTWQVNGVTNGNSTVGTIDANGLYTAPAKIPNPNTLTVTVVSQANTDDIANAAVTLTSDVLVTVSPSTANLLAGQSQTFSAQLTGTDNTTVTWQAGGVTGGNSTIGTITTSGVYTAPSTLTGTLPQAVAIRAVSDADATKSGSASVILHAGSTLTVTPNPASVATFATQQFAAALDSASTQSVTWLVNGIAGGSTSFGTISTSGLYTAPNSVPTTSAGKSSVATPVTVTAVSQQDSTVQGNSIVSIVPPNQAKQTIPAPLGVSGGNAGDTVSTSGSTLCCGGTLGALVSRGGNDYILANSHFLARDDSASLGESIVQPALLDSSCSTDSSTKIANLSQFVNLENPSSSLPLVDAALALAVAGKVDTSGSILSLGSANSGSLPTDAPPHAGSGISPASAVSAHSSLVAKSGRSTGLTCSSIQAIDVTAQIVYQKNCGTGDTFTVTYTDLVDIHDSAFSAEGDSGSLIVTQDTADPVALLVASSDTDTLGNSIADVLAALADPSTSEQPVFVGSSVAHPVAACALPGPQLASAAATVVAEQAPASASLQRASAARDAQAAALLARSGIQAVGAGASLDQPGSAAILLFVQKGTTRSALPAELLGVRTRILDGDAAPQHAALSAAESSALHASVSRAASLSGLSAAELARARAVLQSRSAELLRLSGVQGVGLAASQDNPGEAAILIFLARGSSQDALPILLDGVRTRILESSPFRSASHPAAPACKLPTPHPARNNTPPTRSNSAPATTPPSSSNSVPTNTSPSRPNSAPDTAALFLSAHKLAPLPQMPSALPQSTLSQFPVQYLSVLPVFLSSGA